MYPFRLNSLSNNLYEEAEKNQKKTESQFIKYEKDQLGHMNSCLKLLQEKLVRTSSRAELLATAGASLHQASGGTSTFWQAECH